MKSLFGKLRENASNEQSSSQSDCTLDTPSQEVINPLTFDSIREHQRASLIGWVATKLSNIMGFELSDKITYLRLAVTKDLNSLDIGATEEDYILYLANSLITWIETDKDVYLSIRLLNLKSSYHKSLLSVYELIKDDQSLYFNRKEPDTKDASEDEKLWTVYRDVLHAASQTKFLLITENELSDYISGKLLCDEPIVEKSDIPKVRNIAKEVLEQEGLPKTAVSSYILLISEAITNILKHAKDGRLHIFRSESSINIIVYDKGSGFPLKTLPYTVLTSGYSTKKSFGQGFTLMLKLATRVLLKTSGSGSTIVLVFEENEVESNE